MNRIFILFLIAAYGHVSSADDRVMVFHAGGSVELQVPVDWHVSEMPIGREVRLYLTPAPIRSAKKVSDGIWFAVHASVNGQKLTPQQLTSMVKDRIKSISNTAKLVGQPQSFKVGGATGIRQSLSLQDGSQRAFHGLLVTRFGVVEVHAIAPADQFEQQTRSFDAILRDARFHDPKRDGNQVAGKVVDAKEILGSWKAFRSRMRLMNNGQISIAIDPKPSSKQRGDRLTGTFKAEKDLLLVSWDDGSRLNFRWRLSGETLLLTDHDGQISQLRRILE